MSQKSSSRKIGFQDVQALPAGSSTTGLLGGWRSLLKRKSKPTKKETPSAMIESLSNEDIDMLIATHWREIKGLIKELKRRKECT